MIKVDGDNAEFKGTGADLLSECVVLLDTVITFASDNTGKGEAEILDMILEGYSLSKLLKGGMTYEEAKEVLGIN